MLLDTDNLSFVLYSIYLSFVVLVANKRRFPWACLGMDNRSVYIINRIIHGRLEIWNLSSRVHIWYLTRSLRSLVRYQCEHSKINTGTISPCADVLFSIYFIFTQFCWLFSKELKVLCTWYLFCFLFFFLFLSDNCFSLSVLL